MRRSVAGIFVVLFIAVTPPALAQFGNTGWATDPVEVRESEGEAVLTLLFGGTGNVKYQTLNGSAQAPEDYAAVSGDVFFASAGTREIRVPIANDDLVESTESFQVFAVEDPNPDPWPHRGESVTVRIIDDDGTGTGPESSGTSGAGGRSSVSGESVAKGGSSATGPPTPNDATSGQPPSTAVRPPAPSSGGAVDSVTPTTVGSPSSELQGELASGELRPGPGFELMSDGSAEPMPAQRSGDGGLPLWLVTGAGTATLGVGALAMVQRRRRWSPTQP